MFDDRDQAPLKLLVIEDDAITRALLRSALGDEEFQVFWAEDGLAGAKLFELHEPDLVLTDYSMPGMNGAELTGRVRASLRSRFGDDHGFLPVVIMTGRGEAAVRRECMEAGVVAFIEKPLNVVELRYRTRMIAEASRAQRHLQSRLVEEQHEIAVVKHVLDRLLEQGRAAKPPEFLMETMTTRRINGDACAYRTGAPGIHFGMICDPMGHGLMAGVSAMPTIEVFNALATKDLPLPGILAEINRKLLLLLPSGRFSCSILFRMDWHLGELSVLNAGIPMAFLLGADGSLVRFASTSIPLGIQADLGSARVESAWMAPGDLFFACSDGFSELVSEEEILDLLQTGGAEGFTSLAHDLVARRVHSLELADDVSWCLWPFQPKDIEPAFSAVARHEVVSAEQGLHLRLTLHPGQVNYHEMGPNLVGLLGRLGVPAETCQILALLLSEAIVNAVEHGALGLGSALKEAGFEAFEQERNHRLATGCKGTIEIQIMVHRGADGDFSYLSVLVSDPGLGFPWRQYLAEADGSSATPYGRGLLLLKSLAQDLTFNEKGNEISFRLYASSGH